jgi:uncharacterized damage-inducible protein DinB
MAIKDALLPEFDHEMGSTRRVLERVPAADLKWTPHEKSFNMGKLAWHISNIPNWIHATLDAPIFDLASMGDDMRSKEPASVDEVLKAFDESVKKARDKIAEQTDSAFLSPWTLKQGGQEMFTMPKISVVRSFVMNHIIHHRGQLTVYLRQRNVPLPALYGPSADEG